MSIKKEFEEIRFNINKSILRSIEWFKEGERFGLEFKTEIDKLERLAQELNDDKIKVVLIGAFSEGKTTLAASWLGHVEDDMKIDYKESSDHIQFYKQKDVNDKIVLVDTPGLFGFKEKNEDGDILKYKEITERYISEAHLLLYVVNPINLIKDSHKETCQWLFRDLGKLKHTVFVINKTDELCDLGDEEDYRNKTAIKMESLIKRLNDFIALSIEEKQNLNIIPISANPYGEGLEYWFSNDLEFKKLSRIENLRNSTVEIVRRDNKELYIQQVKSVMKDVVHRKKQSMMEVLKINENEVENGKRNLENIQNDVYAVLKQINNDILSLKEEVFVYLKDIRVRMLGSDIETLSKYFEDDIGSDGRLLEIQIEKILHKYIANGANKLVNLGKKIENELDFTESLSKQYTMNMGKSAISGLKSVPLGQMRSAVLGARNGIVGISKFLGADVAMKFKPWGAVKFAKGIGKVAAGLAIALEVYETWAKYKAKKEFDDTKKKLILFIIYTENFYVEQFSNENRTAFIKEFFPALDTYQGIIDNLTENYEQLSKFKNDCELWFNKADIIQDIDYEIISTS